MAAGDVGFSGAISLSTYMSTDLNSLANATTNVGGTPLDNTTNEHRNIVVEVVLASVDLSAQTNPSVDIYLVPSGDGTNYGDYGSDASTTDLPPSAHLLCPVPIQATNAAHRQVIYLQNWLMNLKYTPVLINNTGAAFAASGNTLKIGTNTDNVAQA